MKFPPSIVNLTKDINHLAHKQRIDLLKQELRSFGLLGFANFYGNYPSQAFPYCLSEYISGVHDWCHYSDAGVEADHELIRNVP